MARNRTPKEPWPRQRSGLVSRGRDHVRIARETGHFISERLGTSLLVWLLVGIALALPAGLYLLQVNLAALTDGWEGRPGLSVYFLPGTSAGAVEALADGLSGHEAVAAVAVISEAEALEEFKALTGLDDALALLDENPLPASLRATLTGAAESADLESLAELARRADGVAEVVMEKTWLQRVTDITRVVGRLGAMLGTLFGLGAVLITATSVRLAIESRLEELKVLRLVGATDAQIRRPFLYFGAVYGVGGALIAAMLISLCLLIIEQPLAALVGSYGGELDFIGFDVRFLGSLFAIAGGLGVLGALVAARMRLRSLEIL